MGGARRLKLDGSIPNQLARAADAAVALERNGFDGGWTAEASHDPFLRCYWLPSTRRDLSLAPTSR